MYGEMRLRCMMKLLSIALDILQSMGVRTITFIDIGSGTGKWMWLVSILWKHCVKYAIGVEYMPQRVALAAKCMLAILDDPFLVQANMAPVNMLPLDFMGVTEFGAQGWFNFWFAFDSAFEPALRSKIAEQWERSPPFEEKLLVMFRDIDTMRKTGFKSIEYVTQLSCTMTGPKGEGKTACFYRWKPLIPPSVFTGRRAGNRRSQATAAVAGPEAGIVNAIDLCSSTGAGRDGGSCLKAYAQGLFDDGLRTAITVTLENGVAAKRGIREKTAVVRFEPSM